jgi:hypothetical protein
MRLHMRCFELGILSIMMVCLVVLTIRNSRIVVADATACRKCQCLAIPAKTSDPVLTIRNSTTAYIPAKTSDPHDCQTDSSCWIENCQHHLCTSEQVPASHYMCDPTNHSWSLTFLSGQHFPTNNQGPLREISQTIKGHQGWSSSIVRGLKDLGPKAGTWNYNPSHPSMLNDVIWTDDCSRARQAIKDGTAKRTKFLVCGAVGFTGQDHDMSDPAVGFIVTPSSSVADRFRDKPTRMRVLVSGVDTVFFAPASNASQVKVKLAVIYYKTPYNSPSKQALVQDVQKALQASGYKTIVITYGSYSLQQWKSVLLTAECAVFLHGTESQSIAQAEAWAMDVPTFVHVQNGLHVFGRDFLQANESPYLNFLNGARWTTTDELLRAVKHLAKKKHHPRRYVLNTMTDEIAMWNALRAIQCEWERRFGQSK